MLVIPSMVVKIGDFKSIGKWVRIETINIFAVKRLDL